MKMIKKATCLVRNAGIAVSASLLSKSAFATDLLAGAMDGDVKDTLGSSSVFWKLFILVDIMLATAAGVKTKNPMVFVGVAGVAFIPAFLLKTLVF